MTEDQIALLKMAVASMHREIQEVTSEGLIIKQLTGGGGPETPVLFNSWVSIEDAMALAIYHKMDIGHEHHPVGRTAITINIRNNGGLIYTALQSTEKMSEHRAICKAVTEAAVWCGRRFKGPNE